MTTFTQLVDETLMTLTGYGLYQPRSSFLVNSIGTDDRLVKVRDASNFNQGIAELGDELVYIDSVEESTGELTLAPDGRGFYGTTPATHAQDSRIAADPVWSRLRVQAALNDAILGVYPTIFGVGKTTFSYNPVVNTYELPSTATRILAVTAETIGPSEQPQVIKRYTLNATAPAEWVSGKTVTLHEPAFPGRMVTVVYAKVPTTLVAGDELSVSGLSDTAKRCLIYGAASSLTAHMDTARLPINAASADELDRGNQVGSAARVSAALFARYTEELEQERRRQAALTPVPVHFGHR